MPLIFGAAPPMKWRQGDMAALRSGRRSLGAHAGGCGLRRHC